MDEIQQKLFNLQRWGGWEAGPVSWDWSQLHVGNLWEVSPPEWAVERENDAIEEEVVVEGAEIGKAELVKLMVEGELVEAGKVEKGEGEMEGKREDKGDKPTPGGMEEVVVRKYGPLSDDWGTD